MKALNIFWAFTRPHTIIGSAVSVTALAFMAVSPGVFATSFFALTLVSALACNVFITGYNQITDVALDRINKPELPLASGALSMGAGKAIVWTALGISLIAAGFVSVFLFFLVGGIAVLGFLYSWKHVFLKRSHLTAAFAITAVRGVLINAGFYLHFSGAERLDSIPPEIWLLTVFITLFSLGIAWFKDIPDMRGDAEARIGTLAVKTGARKAFAAGVMTVGAGYLAGVLVPLLIAFDAGSPRIIGIGHLVIGVVFITFSAKTDPREHGEIQRFYRLFWVLFFAEYILFAAAFAAV